MICKLSALSDDRIEGIKGKLFPKIIYQFLTVRNHGIYALLQSFFCCLCLFGYGKALQTDQLIDNISILRQRPSDILQGLLHHQMKIKQLHHA